MNDLDFTVQRYQNAPEQSQEPDNVNNLAGAEKAIDRMKKSVNKSREYDNAVNEFFNAPDYGELLQMPNVPENVKMHSIISQSLTLLYATKNADYGDSFHKSYEEWGLPMAAIRLGDKYNRFCHLIKNEAKVKDESIRDTLMDLANYSIITLIELEGQKCDAEQKE